MDWRLGTRASCPPGGFLWPVRHWITREGHLDRQVAGVQAPPLGLHTSLPLILPVSQDHSEREAEECELSQRGNGEGESSDRELERLIKQATIKQSAIIKAGIKINWTQGKKRWEKEGLLQERRDWCATFPMQNFFRFQIIFGNHMWVLVQFISTS